MPTPTITIRLPLDTRATLEREAMREGLPLRTYIVRMLMRAGGGGPDVPVQEPHVSTLTFDEKAGVMHEDPPLRLTPVDERSRRHLSPVVMPERAELRSGFGVSETECEHPTSSRKVLSYMTTCTACGKRIQ